VTPRVPDAETFESVVLPVTPRVPDALTPASVEAPVTPRDPEAVTLASAEAPETLKVFTVEAPVTMWLFAVRTPAFTAFRAVKFVNVALPDIYYQQTLKISPDVYLVLRDGFGNFTKVPKM
jgi:hypothetical protein